MNIKHTSVVRVDKSRINMWVCACVCNSGWDFTEKLDLCMQGWGIFMKDSFFQAKTYGFVAVFVFQNSDPGVIRGNYGFFYKSLLLDEVVRLSVFY